MFLRIYNVGQILKFATYIFVYHHSGTHSKMLYTGIYPSKTEKDTYNHSLIKTGHHKFCAHMFSV